MQSLFEKIKELEPKLNGKQRVLAQYILSNSDKISFQNLVDIAKETGTSEATMVRFAKTLGYKGFIELKDDFQKLLLRRLSPLERFDITVGPSNDRNNVIFRVFEKEIQNITEARKKLEMKKIQKIAHLVIKARRKYIVGLRASEGCAFLLGHFLSHVLPDIFTLTNGDTSLFEGIKDIKKEDIMIAISFPRYSKPTIDALLMAKKHGTPTISITDFELSPVSQISDFHVIAPAASESFLNSYTACISIINILITTIITYIDRNKTEAMLKKLDKALAGLDFFYKESSFSSTMSGRRGE